jgi:hypothetical protein
VENEIIDKLAMVAIKAKQKQSEILIPEDEKKRNLIFPKGQGKRTLQQYVKRMAERARPIEYRNSDRIGKIWAIPPPNYAPIDSNQGLILSRQMGDGGYKESTDMASDVINEIINFGRQTIDELVLHLGAYDPNLLTIIINALIQDDYLTIIDKDEDGTRNTLELVEEGHRNRMLESRFEKRLELEHPEWKEIRLLQAELPPGNAMDPLPRYINRDAGEIDYDLTSVDKEEESEEKVEEKDRRFADVIEIVRTATEGEFEVGEYELQERIVKKRKPLKIQDTD